MASVYRISPLKSWQGWWGKSSPPTHQKTKLWIVLVCLCNPLPSKNKVNGNGTESLQRSNSARLNHRRSRVSFGTKCHRPDFRRKTIKTIWRAVPGLILFIHMGSSFHFILSARETKCQLWLLGLLNVIFGNITISFLKPSFSLLFTC